MVNLQTPGYQVLPVGPSPLAELLAGLDTGYARKQQAGGDVALSNFYGTGAPVSQPPSVLQQLLGLDKPATTAPAAGPLAQPQAIGDRAQQLNIATGASQVPESYVNSVIARESAGNPNAANPNSSATGLAQITDGTWADLMHKHPELGLTANGRTDPAQSTAALKALTIDNAKSLASNSLPVNPSTLYLAHFLGAGGAATALQAPDGAAVAQVLPAVAQSNPNVAGMTIGQLKQWAGQGMNASGGYSAPSAPQTGTAPPQQAGSSLPDRATMLAMLRSPDTRPMALAMIQNYQQQQNPSTQLENAARAQQIANFGVPAGYQRIADGSMRAVPGGPDDPNNPLNAMKTGTLGTIMSGNAQVPFTAAGTPDPQAQQQFLASLPPSTASLVKGIADYQIDPTKVASLRGNQRTQLIQLAQQYDPSFDMTQYGVRQAMRRSVSTGQYGQALNSANLVIQHLGELANAADALHNGNFTPLNSVGNTWKTVTGDPAITNFKTIADAAGAELAKVFKGSGASDVSSIQEWQGNLDANSSPAQIHGAIQTAVGGLLKSRLDTIAGQYQAAMGRPLDFRFLNDNSLATLQKLGIDPSSLEPGLAAGDNQAAGTPAGTTAIAHVTSDDDYNALPSGTQFLAPDGTTRTKP